MDDDQSLFWADQLAEKIIERSQREGRKPNVKCQQTPSGGKHIGNLNDVLRAWFPVKSVREKGVECGFVHTTDDRDPLKDVPSKIMDLDGKWHSSQEFKWLEKELGKPLCRVPDPFGCCKSWSDHFTKVWMGGLHMLGAEPELYSVNGLYEQGALDPFVKKVFENITEAGKIVKQLQESKTDGYIPFDAICPECGVLAPIDGFDLQTRKVRFKCGGKAIKKKKAGGCGFEGEADWREGKLQWRFEWPALMGYFHTTFEPFGKDHAEGSWKSVCEIMPRIFGMEPPIPFVYEFFLVNGEKMSASKGNVYVVQDMLEIMEPEAFLFFYTKRPEKQRDLELSRVWQLVDEFDSAERNYFGKEKDRSESYAENLKRMYEVTMHSIPEKCPQRVSYSFAAALVQLLDDETALGKLVELKHLDAKDADSMQLAGNRLKLARKWVEKYAGPESKLSVLGDASKEYAQLAEGQRKALSDFAEKMPENEDAFTEAVKRVCADNSIKPKEFFEAAYKVMLGKDKGPRLHSLLGALGKEFTAKRFKGN